MIKYRKPDFNEGMLKGLFPGTFDPPTKGHLEIIERAASICDRLVVGIGENLAKEKSIFSTDERIDALVNETKKLKNVEVTSFTGLTVDFAKAIDAHTLIRGLRSGSDLDYEKQMARANRLMGLDTLFLLGDEPISSTLIRELAAHGAPLSEYIPAELEQQMHLRMQERR